MSRGRLAALAVLALAWAAACGRDQPGPTISDAAYVRRANAVCEARVPDLRAPERRTTGTTEPTAATVDRVAGELAGVLEELRAIPVEKEDLDEVAHWLADWERYIEVGHLYADAVRSGDPAEYTEVDDEAVRLARRIGRFGRRNGIDECVL